MRDRVERQERQKESGSFPCELTLEDFQTTRGRGRECTGMVCGALESQASLKHRVHDGKERRVRLKRAWNVRPRRLEFIPQVSRHQQKGCAVWVKPPDHCHEHPHTTKWRPQGVQHKLLVLHGHHPSQRCCLCFSFKTQKRTRTNGSQEPSRQTKPGKSSYPMLHTHLSTSSLWVFMSTSTDFPVSRNNIKKTENIKKVKPTGIP